MKKSKALAAAMASLVLTGTLSGCHIDKEQIEAIKATLTSEELAQITWILDENDIVIGEDGIDLPEHFRKPSVIDPGNVTALYGPPPVFVKPTAE